MTGSGCPRLSSAHVSAPPCRTAAGARGVSALRCRPSPQRQPVGFALAVSLAAPLLGPPLESGGCSFSIPEHFREAAVERFVGTSPWGEPQSKLRAQADPWMDAVGRCAYPWQTACMLCALNSHAARLRGASSWPSETSRLLACQDLNIRNGSSSTGWASFMALMSPMCLKNFIFPKMVSLSFKFCFSSQML